MDNIVGMITWVVCAEGMRWMAKLKKSKTFDAWQDYAVC